MRGRGDGRARRRQVLNLVFCTSNKKTSACRPAIPLASRQDTCFFYIQNPEIFYDHVFCDDVLGITYPKQAVWKSRSCIGITDSRQESAECTVPLPILAYRHCRFRRSLPVPADTCRRGDRHRQESDNISRRPSLNKNQQKSAGCLGFLPLLADSCSAGVCWFLQLLSVMPMCSIWLV